MCGIAGFIDFTKNLEKPEGTLLRMIDELSHRGPDGKGIWFDETTGVGLGHRRLSIIDLSSEGNQPMVSGSGRYIISYNGEVYNYKALRKELQKLGKKFRSQSDTEVILSAIEIWGLENALPRFCGMFALAIFDIQLKKLFLVRDRLGIKPIYYGYVKGAFVFASELKSFLDYPEFPQTINRNALSTMIRFCYIPSPHSIYEEIYKLPPGHVLSLDSKNNSLQLTSYWNPRSVLTHAIENTFNGTRDEAVDRLDELIRDAVNLRMISDVPLGAFLSGGIDSSTVVAIMQAQSNRPIRTFSIGFFEEKYNEATYAKSVAQHLGTDHTELYVTPQEAMDVIPDLPTVYDEPFADSSQIPTLLVSKLAREQVTVSLSGDGGDELFCGYRRYHYALHRWKQISWMPYDIRRKLGSIIKTSLLSRWSKPHTFASLLTEKNLVQLYKWLLSNWKNPEDIVINSEEPQTAFDDELWLLQLPEWAQQIMFIDLVCYLPDDILVKLDRASMAVSLESRVPLLDHRIVEFAWRLPIDLKIYQGEGKWILRKVLEKYVPRELVNRPKKGFGIPIGMWLRGPLRDWAESLLDERRLSQEGYLTPSLVREKWADHLKEKRSWQYELWNVLMFQSWLETVKRR